MILVRCKLFSLFALLLIVLGLVSKPLKSTAQTIFGQQGTLLTPSADPYRLGNFILGGYFRSLNYKSGRFDVSPAYLLVGFASNMEVGFSFPNVWNGSATPTHSDNYATLSLKYRCRGKEEDAWRWAVGGLLRRGAIYQVAGGNSNALYGGLEVISSYNFYRNYQFHAVFGGTVAVDGQTHQIFGGAGVERQIASPLHFLADLMAARESGNDGNATLQLLAGLRYFPFPNVHLTAAGGMGLASEDFSWQYLIGFSLTSDFQRTAMFEGQDEIILPPPLESLEPSLPPPAPENIGLVLPSAPVEGPPGQSGMKSEVEVESRLFFDFARYRLGENELDELEELRVELGKLEGDLHFKLIGCADFVGSNRENLAWGIARALNVIGHLYREENFPPERFLVSSGGEEIPSDVRTTPAANQLNRRVIVRTWRGFAGLQAQAQSVGKSWDIREAAGTEEFLSNREKEAVRGIIQQIGTLDSTQALLIEAVWVPNTDPWPALQKAAALWLFIAATSQIEPSQIYFHIGTVAEGLPPYSSSGEMTNPTRISKFPSRRWQKHLAGALEVAFNPSAADISLLLSVLELPTQKTAAGSAEPAH